MPQPEDLGLEAEFRQLAMRVERIERELGLVARSAGEAAASAPAAAVAGEAPVPSAAALLPPLGRALLGLAGAYLLRAYTESGGVSTRIGVAVGVVYAVMWLVWAARTPAEKKLEAALHSLTSVLVLCPLLWEAVIRFQAVPASAAGAILLFFTLFGLAVSWRKNLLVVATIATLAGLGTASALLVATHDVLPFTVVLLAIAAAVEASACLDHWLSERWLAATAANLAILLATWLVTNERGLPEQYAPVSHSGLLTAQIALLAIYLSSTIVRTLLRGFTFTTFETAQVALAFLISVGGGLRLAATDPRLGPAMAILTLGCAVACYGVSFFLLDPGGAGSRNFYTYSTFAFLLTIVGTRILLAGVVASAVWSVAAVACLWAGGYWVRLTLQVHGGLFLFLALVSSGAFSQAAAFLVGDATWPGENDLALAWGAVAAAFCYVLALRFGRGRTGWNFQAFLVATSGILAWLAAGLTAGVLTAGYHGIFGVGASHAYCATIRTGLVAVSALLLAWMGARAEYRELGKLIYPAMALGAWRLVMEDLHQERKAALVLSLLMYGTALMLLPRFKRAA